MLGSPSPADPSPRRGIVVDPTAIRRARREAHLTLGQVAEPELTRGTIWQIEQGRARPSLRTLRQIAHRTGRPISYFLVPGAAPTEQQRGDCERLRTMVETEDFAGAIILGNDLLGADALPSNIEAEVRLLMGRAHVRRGDGIAASEHLLRAEQLCELTGDRFMAAEVLDALGCAFFLADDPRSLKVGWEALHAAERLVPPAPELMIQVLVHLGSFLLRIRDWRRAIDCYDRALRLSGSTTHVRNVAMLYDQLAIAHQWLGHSSLALQHARYAARLYAGSKDPSDAVRASNNMGWLLMKQGQADAAFDHFSRALELCDEYGVDREGSARIHVLLNLAEVHIDKKELDSAEARLKEVLHLTILLKQTGHRAAALRMFGRLHYERADYGRSIEMFEEAARLYEDRRLLVELAEVLQEKGLALKMQGRVFEAAECWQLATTRALEAVYHSHDGLLESLE